MPRFTIHDLAATIDARAASGGEASYTRKLLDKGAEQARLVEGAVHGYPDHRTAIQSLPYLHARAVGAVARRHADDAGAGRIRAVAFDARSAGHAGGGGHLPAAVAPAVDLCRRHP